jgi:hypothetical protein
MIPDDPPLWRNTEVNTEMTNTLPEKVKIYIPAEEF